jgi:2-amino-4-hydroxy-6-hydroxymethyldihydropteridine diphosphokinase
VIILGIGGNLPTRFGPPRETHAAALVALAARGVHPVRVSRLWRTAPVPASDQPWFVNAVAEVDSALPPHELLAVLNEVEADFGRLRGARNAPRGIDLDLLDYHGWLTHTDSLDLPHPRLHQRAFVLLPLAEVAPNWRHPLSHRRLSDLIADLPPDQVAEAMD